MGRRVVVDPQHDVGRAPIVGEEILELGHGFEQQQILLHQGGADREGLTRVVLKAPVDLPEGVGDREGLADPGLGFEVGRERIDGGERVVGQHG